MAGASGASTQSLTAELPDEPALMQLRSALTKIQDEERGKVSKGFAINGGNILGTPTALQLWASIYQSMHTVAFPGEAQARIDTTDQSRV